MSLFSRLTQKLTKKKESPVIKPQAEPAVVSCKCDDPLDLIKKIGDSLQNGVLVLDINSKVIFANSAAEKITGSSAPSLTGKTADQILQKKDELEIKTVAVEKTSAEVNQSGIGSILILHDKTQEKVFEQMQIDFVSMASHEFRTPLTSIINYLTVLLEETGKDMKADQKDLLDRALSSSKDLSVLVDNILNVSKVERGSLSISLGTVDWNKSLETAIENNKAQAVQKNITFETKFPTKPLPNVTADKIRISEVLNNLIANAITYTKDGGTIELGANIDGKEVITYIKDNGIGIPEEAIPHLFTKFFRGPGALENNAKGTGLGLYLSKSIIDFHHGRIWVESKAGKGSTFYFSLPIAEKSQTPTIVDLHS